MIFCSCSLAGTASCRKCLNHQYSYHIVKDLIDSQKTIPENSAWFRIGETLVDESKGHITPEQAIRKIREYLRMMEKPSVQPENEFLEFLWNVINPNDMEKYLSMYHSSKATDSEMPFPIPNSCGECIYRHEFYSGYYCNHPTDKKRQMLDISTFKICLDTKPDWCPMEITRQKINELSAEDRKLLDKVCAGFNAMFELMENMSNEK